MSQDVQVFQYSFKAYVKYVMSRTSKDFEYVM